MKALELSFLGFFMVLISDIERAYCAYLFWSWRGVIALSKAEERELALPTSSTSEVYTCWSSWWIFCSFPAAFRSYNFLGLQYLLLSLWVFHKCYVLRYTFSLNCIAAHWSENIWWSASELHRFPALSFIFSRFPSLPLTFNPKPVDLWKIFVVIICIVSSYSSSLYLCPKLELSDVSSQA